MNVGSLFSGIGGFDLGLERAGYDIAWQVEIDEYCRKVLGKHWPEVPCHADIKTIDWSTIPTVDLVCGGFPCQPFSCAGQRRGTADDQYLWPEVVRCLAVLRPTWFLGENVPGIVNLALDQVHADLEGLGYEVVTFNIPACAVDAPHQRKRIWIVAHTRRPGPQGHRGEYKLGEGRKEIKTSRCGDVADANSQQKGRTTKPRQEHCEWLPEPAVGMLADGLPAGLVRWRDEPKGVPRVAHKVQDRVERLKGLGNAVVPQIVEALGRMILAADGLHTRK